MRGLVNTDGSITGSNEEGKMKCVSCGKEAYDSSVGSVPCCSDCYTDHKFYDWCVINRPDLIVKKNEVEDEG